MPNRTLTARSVPAGEMDQTGQLVQLMYEDLCELAKRILARNPQSRNLEAAALVHETFLRMVHGKSQVWQNHAHFFAAANETMQRILIEEARRRRSQRHGGQGRTVHLENVQLALNTDSDLFLTMNNALEELALVDPLKAKLVHLRFFHGLSIKEAGKELGLAERTVKWHWSSARVWLSRELSHQLNLLARNGGAPRNGHRRT